MIQIYIPQKQRSYKKRCTCLIIKILHFKCKRYHNQHQQKHNIIGNNIFDAGHVKFKLLTYEPSSHTERRHETTAEESGQRVQ